MFTVPRQEPNRVNTEVGWPQNGLSQAAADDRSHGRICRRVSFEFRRGGRVSLP